MSRCSDPTYEPGPVTELDLGGFDGTLEPPVFTPMAQSFATQSGGWLSTLDASIAVLEAESLLDIGGDVLDTIGGIGSGASASVNQEALAHLTAAESGFAAVRDRVGELKTWLPPDVLKTQYIKLLDVIVSDGAGARVAGALVQIDADYGGGTTRVTDGTGIALFEVAPGVTVGWTVTAPGFAPRSGIATLPALADPVNLLPVLVTLSAS